MDPKQTTTQSSLKGAKEHKRPRSHDAAAGTESAKKKRMKRSNRKYNESYIKYGFIAAGESHAQRPLCLVCGDTLSNDALKPSKLLRHFESRHPELKGAPVEFFEQRKQKLLQEAGQNEVLSVAKPPTKEAASRQPEKKKSISRRSTNLVAVRVGLTNLVASLIREIKEPFTISEELILPACELIVREILGGEPAANNTAHVHPSEDEIAEDVEAQLIERIKGSPWYALQVDECTDVDNRAVILVYVRYVFQDDVHVDLLCPLSMPTNTTAADLFKALDNFMSGKLKWSYCVGLCTDGAAALTGPQSGFTARVKRVAPECDVTHCIIHREMLVASQKMSPELNGVLNDVVKMINHIRAQALNSNLFEQLCGEDTDPELKCLLLHTEVRWLSRGRSLARVFDLRAPLERFLSESNSPLAVHFSDEEWVAKLAYLCDIFNLLNEFSVSLQGRMANVFTMADKAAALKTKLGLWGRRVDKGSFDMFHSLAEVLGETEPVPSFSQLVSDHLASLSEELERYFPASKYPQEWIRDPFENVPGDETSLTMEDERQLFEVASDSGLKSLFWTTSSLPTFWIKVRAMHREIATEALKTLLPFPTTFPCEAGFASMMARKTELRNRLHINNTLRVSLSRTLDRLVARKQARPHPLRKENGSH